MTQGSKTMPELSLTVCLNDADQKAVNDYAQAWLDLVDALEARLDRAIEQSAGDHWHPEDVDNDAHRKPSLPPAQGMVIHAGTHIVNDDGTEVFVRFAPTAACEDIAKRMEE